VPTRTLDLTDAAGTQALFAEERLDAVIHFAPRKAVGESVVRPAEYYRTNLDSTLSLIEAMKQHDVTRMVFSSSATVYGDPKALPIVETAPVGAVINPYGRTKLIIEDMGRDLAASLGEGRTALMRGHGAVVIGQTIRHAVFISVYLELAAKLQMQAMPLGSVKYLTDGEVEKVMNRTGPYTLDRAWENWCRRAGRQMTASA
jgi:nucleoside-diphosphate-sugar epimerase